jgi:protein ImuB
MLWIALRAWPEAGPVDAGSVQALGCHALRCTPRVSLAPAAVLMEVSASLRLFGGLAPMLAQLRQQILSTGMVEAVTLQAAPGQTALQALARLQLGLPWRESARIPIGKLPLACLGAAGPYLPVLERLGCRQWQDLRALPRGGVARRFGQGLLDALDQAYGDRPDICDWLQLPEVFEDRLQWPDGVEHAQALVFAARRLLQRLQAWLLARSQGVLGLELQWQIDARRGSSAPALLLLRLSEPTQDMAHVLRLLAERLAGLRLSAPVQALVLRTVETAALRLESQSLLPDEQRRGESLVQLLERLGQRLGGAQVQRWQPCDRHVPERMQQWLPALAVDSVAGLGGLAPHRREGAAPTGSHTVPHTGPPTRSPARSRAISNPEPLADSTASLKAGSKAGGVGQGLGSAPTPTLPQRGREKKARSEFAPPGGGLGWGEGDLLPTWLLPQPQPLRLQGERPCYEGPLALLVGPQRLESSAWMALSQAVKPQPAEAAVMRDYFIARSPQAGLLWIYRERRADAERSWFLHGIFA